MNLRSFIIVLPVFLTSLNAQTTSMHNLALWMGGEKSGFMDEANYTTAHHGGSPLGWLEHDSSSARVDLLFSYLNLEDNSGNGNVSRTYAVPHIRLGNPGVAVVDFVYYPTSLEKSSPQGNIKLPLHRFSLGVAGGTESGLFQIGLRAGLFTGRISQEEFPDERFILGSDQISVHLGTQLHELVRVGVFGGVSGYFDSLVIENPEVQDRYFSGTFPILGGFIDLSKEGFPVFSNFSLGMGFPRFVYVYKPSTFPAGNNPALFSDSIGWDWKTLVKVGAGDFTIRPAFAMGYQRTTSQLYHPTEDNYPWEHGDEITGYHWTISSFGMGMGVATDFLKIAELSVQYGFKNLSLEKGLAIVSSYDEKEWFHDIKVGIQGNVHKIEKLRFPQSLGLTVRAEYFNMRQSQYLDPWYHGEFSRITLPGIGSQAGRYTPESSLLQTRLIGINAGIGATFLEEMFGVDADLVLFDDASGVEKKGVQFGIGLWYNLIRK